MSAGWAAGLQALLVDADEPQRRLLGDLFTQAGAAVEAVDGVAAGIQRCSEGSFDLLVVDTNLPDGSGLSFVQWIVAGGQRAAVILTTARLSTESVLEALKLNVDDYLLKPYAPAEVSERLRRVVERLQLTRREQQLLADLRDKNLQLERLAQELTHKNRVLEALATRDVATGLYNHAHAQERLAEELARCAQGSAELALLLLDIDRFKQINDTLGHAVGERLLKLLADALGGEGPREFQAVASGRPYLTARWGADVFLVILPETGKLGAVALGEALRAWFERAMLDQRLGAHTLSVGAAAFPADGTERDALLRAADSALYFAKRGGGNRVMAYVASIGASGAEQTHAAGLYLKRIKDIEQAIAQAAFDMHYQPIVRADTLSIFAYEALVRPRGDAFRHPGELFEAASVTGMTYKLGAVLRRLTIAPIGGLAPPGMLFINIHPQELGPELVAEIEASMLPCAGRIVFEVTEAARLADLRATTTLLQRLKGHGFMIALDDLGAGYSGLNTLVQLRPDFIKLDMEMLRGLRADSHTSRLIRHLLEYADGEGMIAIAEGIETDEQRRVVTEIGCPLLQGYFFARPAPPFVQLDLERINAAIRAGAPA